VDFPNGNTVGRVFDTELNRRIVTRALELVDHTEGEILRDLPYVWDTTDQWKDSVYLKVRTESGEMKMLDDRVERYETPQFQSDADATAAAQTHDGESCLVCAGIDF